MESLAKIIVIIAEFAAVLMLLSYTLGNAFKSNDDVHDFFMMLAGFARTMLLLGMPIWVIALIFAIGK